MAKADSDINAKGEDIDIDIDQDIDETNTSADRGGVAVNGDVSRSPIVTGSVNGIVSAGDVDAREAVFGNGNVVLNDSTVGAFALGGDATNATGRNVNLGRDMTVVENSGDGQVAVGEDIRQSGDVDVDVDDVNGNLNLAIGDNNRQEAFQDNSETIEDSFNTRIDTRIEDNDDFSQHDSNNWDWKESYEENLHYEDNDTEKYSSEEHYTETDQHADVWGDDNDVDLDA